VASIWTSSDVKEVQSGPLGKLLVKNVKVSSTDTAVTVTADLVDK